jgi:hypothetical protein
MSTRCKVPPLRLEERAELYESQFVCSIQGLYGFKKVTVHASNKADAIVQCMRQHGKRPSDVQPVQGGEMAGSEQPLAVTRVQKAARAPEGSYEPHSMGPLTMKR